MIKLRPYQTQAIDQMRDLMRKGCKSILYRGATGSGKTALTAHMLHTASSKGMRCLFVVHRRELIKQSIEAFNKEGLAHGVIGAGYREDNFKLVQIAGIATLMRRLARYRSPSLIVWDECHHLAAKGWRDTYGSFSRAYHVGLTATPERMDGQGLGEYFQAMIHGPSIQDLTAQGYLSPYRLYAPMTISTEGVHMRMGDFARNELQGKVDRPSITGDVVAHYKKYAHGKRTLIFCVSIAHSKHVAEQFCAAGYQAMHVDGETDPQIRDDAMRRFKDGNVQILTSVEIFGEGVDVPALECVVLLRPTQSLGLYLQQIGRALRVFDGKKEATILDHVGNTMRHGLPDEDRQWSLSGHERVSRGSATESVTVRICPSCFAAQPAGATACKFCQYVFETKPRKVDEKEGELSEVDKEAIRRDRLRNQGQSESLEELTQLGISRGYKFPRRWAYYVFKSRQAKRLGKA